MKAFFVPRYSVFDLALVRSHLGELDFDMLKPMQVTLHRL